MQILERYIELEEAVRAIWPSVRFGITTGLGKHAGVPGFARLLEPRVGMNSLLDCISKLSAPLLQAALESAAHLDTRGAGIPSQHAQHLEGKQNTPSHPHASPGHVLLV